MKTMKSSNGGESNRRVFHPVNHDRMRDVERDRSRSSKDGREQSYSAEEDGKLKNEKKDVKNLSKENRFGDTTEGESKSIHVEDWENDPYDKESVRGELDLRDAKKTEKGERANDITNEGKDRTGDAGTNSALNKEEDKNKGSGRDETIGVP
jgi:hypothetical protein